MILLPNDQNDKQIIADEKSWILKTAAIYIELTTMAIISQIFDHKKMIGTSTSTVSGKQQILLKPTFYHWVRDTQQTKDKASTPFQHYTWKWRKCEQLSKTDLLSAQ